MIAEVPNTLYVPADRSNYGLRPPSPTTYSLVVFHITSGHPAAMPVAQMWQEPHHGSSAHFVIGQDGTCIQCVPMRFAAFHAHRATNGISIGIEHCAREPKEFDPEDPGLPLSQVQLARSAKLTAYLLKAAGMIPILHLNIQGHAEADPLTTHTGCPNAVAGGMDWDGYMTMVNIAYDQIGKDQDNV